MEPVIGWPIYMSAMILGHNVWGWWIGEWKGVRGKPVSVMLWGILFQVVAMFLLGIGNSP